MVSLRYEEDLREKLRAQQTKEFWHTRIHRRPTEAELHRKVAGKTAQSIVDAALNRCEFGWFITTRPRRTISECNEELQGDSDIYMMDWLNTVLV